MEERIVIKKKIKEYLDNYQYHETKNIKNPNPIDLKYALSKKD